MTRYSLIWSDDTGEKRDYYLRSKTWTGRPGGFNISEIDPYMVILIPDNENPVSTGIYDSTVSRKHAIIEPAEDGLLVTDHGSSGKGSSNGTYINEKRVPPGNTMKAVPGDSIRLGLYTVFKVGIRDAEKSIELVRPGDLVVVDSDSITKVPQELLRSSVRMDIGKYLVYIPKDVSLSRTSFDTSNNIRVRVDHDDKTDTLSLKRRIIQNMILYLKDIQLDLNKDPPKSVEAASKLNALLKVTDYREALEDIVGSDTIRDMTILADLILRGRAGPPQIHRLITEVDTLEKALDLKLKALTL